MTPLAQLRLSCRSYEPYDEAFSSLCHIVTRYSHLSCEKELHFQSPVCKLELGNTMHIQ